MFRKSPSCMTACSGDLFAQCGGAIAGASVMLGLLGEADPGQQTHEVGAGRLDSITILHRYIVMSPQQSV